MPAAAASPLGGFAGLDLPPLHSYLPVRWHSLVSAANRRTAGVEFYYRSKGDTYGLSSARGPRAREAR